MNKLSLLISLILSSPLVSEEQIQAWQEEGTVNFPTLYDGDFKYDDKSSVVLQIENIKLLNVDGFKVLLIQFLRHHELGQTFNYDIDELDKGRCNVQFFVNLNVKTKVSTTDNQATITYCNDEVTLDDLTIK